MLNRFPAYYAPSSLRVIFTATAAAKQHLFYLQETGYLKLLQSHPGTQRSNLNSFLLALVEEGAGRLTYRGQRFALQAGQCFFIDCSQPHSYESSSDTPWALYWAHFNGPSAPWLYGRFEAEHKPVCSLSEPGRWQKTFQALIQAAQTRQQNSEIQISGLLTGLLAELFTQFPAPPAGQTPFGRLEKVHEYIAEHFTQPLTLDELSRRFYLSKFHLARSFKERYGLTLLEYQTHLRINYAKQLLRYSQLSLEETGAACGYKSQSYFCRVFRRTEGTSALQYRQSWRGKP